MRDCFLSFEVADIERERDTKGCKRVQEPPIPMCCYLLRCKGNPHGFEMNLCFRHPKTNLL